MGKNMIIYGYIRCLFRGKFMINIDCFFILPKFMLTSTCKMLYTRAEYKLMFRDKLLYIHATCLVDYVFMSRTNV